MRDRDVRQLLTDAAEQAGTLEASTPALARAVRGRRRRHRAGTAAAALGCATAVLLAPHALTATPAHPPAGTPAATVSTNPPCDTGTGTGTRTGTGAAGDDGTGAAAGGGSTERSACRYLGLTLSAARAQAAAEQRYLVIGSQDGTHFVITYQFDVHRVVVELVHDHVVRASIG